MEKSSLQNYLGIPVLVQLKLPLVGTSVVGYRRLRFAEDPEKPQWLPGPVTGPQGGIEATQVMAAVLLEVEGSETMLEIRWEMMRAKPEEREAVLATLIDLDSIAAVTRVHSVSESSLIIKG